MRNRCLGSAILLLLGLMLASCASSTIATGYAPPAPEYAPTHYYPPPGPPNDPWGPYITEAAARFAVPGTWIRAVMAQESGGEEQAVSPTGAIGLMQVEPETYQALQAQYGLGGDPFDPHDNILAGAAYIKEMYDRYGAPGFLAAYNAGPGRLDDYIANGTPLPDETVNYLAAVTPNLGSEVAFSGPLASYARAGGGLAPTAVGFATGCDVNAAYDPGNPCTATSGETADGEVAPTSAPPAVVATNAGTCDADTAYDPASPCSATAGAGGACDTDNAYDPGSPCHAALAPVIPAVVATTAEPGSPPELAPVAGAGVAGAGSAVYDPAASPVEPAPAAPAPAAAASVPANWTIQVGAFAAPGLARAVAEGARAEAPSLAGADIQLPPTTPFGGRILYRAQLARLTPAEAIRACTSLNARQLPCVVLPGA